MLFSKVNIDKGVLELIQKINADMSYTTLEYIKQRIQTEGNRINALMYQNDIMPNIVQDKIVDEILPKLDSAVQQIDAILADKPHTNFSVTDLTNRLRRL